MAVSFVALFVALAGSALAVQRNSVGSRELQRNAVKSPHIKNRQVKAADLRGGAVKTGKLADGAVTEAKLADGLAGVQGPAGPRGPAGPQGPQGPKGDLAPGAVVGQPLPADVTLRGVVAAASGRLETQPHTRGVDGVSFAFPLAARPEAHIVDLDGGETPPSECPGTAEVPDAVSGHLCIFVTGAPDPSEFQFFAFDPVPPLSGASFSRETGQTTTFGDGTVSRFGFEFRASETSDQATALTRGTWAVTG